MAPSHNIRIVKGREVSIRFHVFPFLCVVSLFVLQVIPERPGDSGRVSADANDDDCRDLRGALFRHRYTMVPWY